MSPSSFSYRLMEQGRHVQVSVFAGPDEQHRAWLGRLTMCTEGLADFRDHVEVPGHTFITEPPSSEERP